MGLRGERRRRGCSLPVVEQDVRSPDLVRGETEVLHPGMFALVPLEVVVEPALRRTGAAWKDSECRSKPLFTW